jgi:transcriptional regulator with XRE-family HTH domain
MASKLSYVYAMLFHNDKKFLIAFGEHLKKIRLEKNYSQEKLSFESGLETRQLGRIERGEINTGIYSAAIIAKAMDIDLTQLFNFKF